MAATGLTVGAGYAVWSGWSSGGEPDPAAGAGVPALAEDEARDGVQGDESDSPAEARPKPGKAPASAAETDEDGSDTVASAADGKFYVLVASYRSNDDAAAYVETLTERGLPAESVTESSWHRVRLGPYQSRPEAETARFKLKLHERRAAHVMPRSNGKYHVQVGSFATRDKAEPVAERLSARGHVTKISRIKMGERRWYCVRIGPFDTAEEARGYRELVDERVAGGKTAVIPYPPPKI